MTCTIELCNLKKSFKKRAPRVPSSMGTLAALLSANACEESAINCLTGSDASDFLRFEPGKAGS
jgi:hypothetical protein